MHNRHRRLWLFLGLLGVFVLAAPLPVPAVAAQERHFHVEASSFNFSPGEIRVQRGDRVTIDLTATDVVHGLYIDGYGLDVVAEPGQTASITFVADQPGSFRFRCSITCGAMHPFMIGKLTVGSNTLMWKALALAAVAAVAGLWSVRK